MKNTDKNNQMKKIIKKGAGISLCAVLAGGLAAGTFEGVNYLTGWNQPERVEAAINDDEKLTLTKSESAGKGSLDVSDIAAEAMPSVVSITTKSVQEVQAYYGMFGSYGYAPEEREVEGSGSGIIIGKNDEELLVVTNYHVVEGANTLSVCFVDGQAYEGTVKGYEQNKDLAVVSIPLEDISDETKDEISVAKIGSSDDLVVGEQVVAIGNALGYGQSVTTGIVSAKNRRMDSSSGSFQTGDEENSRKGVNLIQTDAAINPGNSGGALLNMNGEVVGINSAKLASTDVEGMGYAIAISDVADVLENLMNQKPRDLLDDGEHGVLGIVGSTVSDEGVQIYGIPEGVFVKEVTEDGGADKAGLEKNSVITEFDGKSVTSIEQLVDYLKYYEPGEKVDVVVEVPDGNSYKEETLTIELGEDTSTPEDKEDKEKSDGEDDSEESEEEEQNDESIFKKWEEDGENRIEEFFGNW